MKKLATFVFGIALVVSTGSAQRIEITRNAERTTIHGPDQRAYGCGGRGRIVLRGPT